MSAPNADRPISLIEQAARRLDELRRTGIEIPVVPPSVESLGRPPVRVGSDAHLQSIEPVPFDAPNETVEIDLARLSAQGYLMPGRTRTLLSDEFRVVKRPLLQHMRSTPSQPGMLPNLVMVTSAEPGEGKTFVAMNLALSLATERDMPVLLVDGDVSRPSVFTRFGVQARRGLLDAVARDDVSLSDAIVGTNIPQLSLMAEGKPVDHATEWLASDSMVRLLARLSQRYAGGVVVFDAPPLLPSTESRALALNMGQVVFVVEAERTLRSTVTDALATIQHCRAVFPVLNKAQRTAVGGRYGYHDYAPPTST